MKSPVVRGLLALLLILSMPHAWAEKADKDKPMNVEADNLRYDDLKQTTVITGNVVLTKGTILIRGAKAEVRQDPQGYQYGMVTGEAGKRANFRQKRDGVDEYIEGEAELIEYDGRTDTLKFSRQAQLRRYRGSALNDEFNAGVIVYNATTDVFSLDGATGVGASSSSGQPGVPAGRVRATLTPKPAVVESAPPGARLQASPALGGASR
jgi:lipopolysaccharide export system protein LptA